jgi:DNA-binding GntR family transcriptional regulator
MIARLASRRDRHGAAREGNVSSETEALAADGLAATAAGHEGDHEALVNSLADRIQLGIVTSEFPVGARLRQEHLAERFGVSRTPVREALRMLHARGSVILIPNRGAVVRAPTTKEIRDAYAIRAELEGLAAELTAMHAREAQLEALAAAARLFRQSVAEYVRTASSNETPDLSWMQANDLFHEAILEAAGNERLRRIISELHLSFPRNLTWSALSEEPSLIEDNVNEHQRILAAIQRREPEAARRWMTDHVKRAGELVASWFERHGGDNSAEAAGASSKRRSARRERPA